MSGWLQTALLAERSNGGANMKYVGKPSRDWDLRLECTCADDFGAGYKSELTDEEEADLVKFEETRDAHHRLRELAETAGIRNYITDTDDGDSRHSDAYLYFLWSDVEKIVKVLKEAGVTGDILDVPKRFPVVLREIAEGFGWKVERATK